MPHFKEHNTAREKFEQAGGQEMPTDGALVISDLKARIEVKMAARCERKFEEQQKQFALVVAECSKRLDAPTTQRHAAAQILVADTSDDESDKSEEETDNKSVAETKNNHNRRVKQRRDAVAAKRSTERKQAKKRPAKP